VIEKDRVVMTAKTVEEAIEIALLELDAGREEVEVDVVSKGKAGILGIGGEPAKVRVTRIMDSGGEAGSGLRAVNKIMKLMDVEAQATIRTSGSGPEEPSIIDVQGTDAGLLIGRRGETLQALQFVVNMIVSRELDRRTTVLVDVEQYRMRRQQNLESMAERMAERVVSSGRPMSLEPMSAADRRIIHMALSSNGNVSTESSGEGHDRKITISPGGRVSNDDE
jgi:spoIIIJ-associated protein